MVENASLLTGLRSYELTCRPTGLTRPKDATPSQRKGTVCMVHVVTSSTSSHRSKILEKSGWQSTRTIEKQWR